MFSSRFGLGLAFSVCLGLSAPLTSSAIAQSQPTSFSDVSTDYWARDYIDGLAKSNIISGFPDGTFKPNNPVTRAQFAAILRQAFLQSQPTTAQSFKDVPAGYWATGAIASARSAGFLSGYPDNTFKPNDRILRVQALISLANGLKYSAGNPQVLSSYKDADTVPAYARPSTAAAAQANLVVSYPSPDQILPNRAASRAEVAAFVYQALAKAGRVDPITTKPEKRWQTAPVATISTQSEQISLSRNGQRLANITIPYLEIQVWNTQTGALLRSITTDSSFTAVAISPDGTKVAALEGEQLTVWAVEDGKVLLTQSVMPPKNQLPKTDYALQPGQFNVVFSADDQQVITQVVLGNRYGGTDALYNRIDFRSIATGKVTQSVDIPSVEGKTPKGYIVSPDGSLLASLSADYSDSNNWQLGSITHIAVWQRNQNNRFDYLTTLPISKDGSSIFNVAFTTSNLLNLTTESLSNLAANKPAQTRLETWNPQTSERVSSAVLPTEKCIRSEVAVPSPDGTSYYSSLPNAETCFGNVKAGEFQKLPARSFAYKVVKFSDDGSFLAVATFASPTGPSIQIFSKSQN